MKNLLLLFVFVLCAQISQAHQVEPETEPTAATIIIQFKPYDCNGDRAIWSTLFADLNAALAQLGPSMAVTEIVAHSYETVGGVPLCTCRYNNVLNKINQWSAANGIGQTTNPLVQGCVTHPANFSGNPNEHMQVIVKLDAFL